MQNATHYIEQFGNKEEYKYEDKIYVQNTICNSIKFLEEQLDHTKKCPTLKTIAVFKIKLKF